MMSSLENIVASSTISTKSSMVRIANRVRFNTLFLGLESQVSLTANAYCCSGSRGTGLDALPLPAFALRSMGTITRLEIQVMGFVLACTFYKMPSAACFSSSFSTASR